MWLWANNYGLTSNNLSLDNSLISSLYLPVDLNENLYLEAGLEGVVRTDVENSFINQMYLKLKYRKLTLRLGKEAFSLGQYNEELSSGSMFLSGNSRPFPRIGAGFYEYTQVPFIQGILQFKGAAQVGVLNGNRGEQATKKPYIHEKFFYLKTAGKNLNVWIGMNHSVLMGGTRANGEKIPIDFWASFWGKGSAKFKDSYAGEYTNAAGAHFGLFDFGWDWDIKDWHIDMYYQKPIADRSGMRGIFNWEHDKILGVNLASNQKRIVNQVLLEYIKTDYQSGVGTPDYAVNGSYLDPKKVTDYEGFIYDNFGVVADNVTWDEFLGYLTEYLNMGYETGGRDNYYNNGLYYKGNNSFGYALGSPLMLTQDFTGYINNIGDLPYDRYFISNRLLAFHLGIGGWLTTQLNYRFLGTWTQNYGTYTGLYGGFYSWNEQDDYFFKGGKLQNYLLFELNYELINSPLSFSAALGRDRGDLYRSTAVRFTARWKI